MDPKDRELLERTLELAEENNQILHRIQSATRWARFWRIFYWALIIGTSVGAYYFIQPYIDRVMGIYSGFQQDVENIKGTASQAGDIIKNLPLIK